MSSTPASQTALEIFQDEKSGAKFSDCRKYRYALWRIWDESKPLVMFIGLNPSTANEATDDPTIRRVKAMAKNWGYGGVYMMNLFAWVSAYPQDLLTCEDAVGGNDYWLWHFRQFADKVIFAWGNFKEAVERGKKVAEQFPDSYALQINKNGSPKHPLYVKGDIIPILYKANP
jgi:hypothetical protein